MPHSKQPNSLEEIQFIFDGLDDVVKPSCREDLQETIELLVAEWIHDKKRTVHDLLSLVHPLKFDSKKIKELKETVEVYE